MNSPTNDRRSFLNRMAAGAGLAAIVALGAGALWLTRGSKSAKLRAHDVAAQQPVQARAQERAQEQAEDVARTAKEQAAREVGAEKLLQGQIDSALARIQQLAAAGQIG